MKHPIPTEFQHPPEEKDSTQDPPDYRPTKESFLTLRKKDGHCIMELSRGLGSQDMIWTQSAGNELEDALQKAKTIWKLGECVPISRTKQTEKWKVKFTD